MQKRNFVAGALVALCLIGMLALPVSAAPLMTAGNAANAGTADPGLKDDLRANHMHYRLARFDMNVQQANGVIAILNTYGIKTTACQATLSTISGRRADLEGALQTQDHQKLKTVNDELKTLWKQFLQEVRDAIRSHYGKSADRSALSSLDGFGPGSS